MGLNGYPIASHSETVTRLVLDGVQAEDFPVQVRHGSACPVEIFRALIRAGLDASEGGPVSYCLPYGRTPLAESVRNWAACCELLLPLRESGAEPHLETFGGCMMGQLCPPSLLVAISVIEALFFFRHGIRSISVSYAQQTNMEQDKQAIYALRKLCAEFLPPASWHVVVYTYMGLYPRTPEGARELLARAVELAVATGSERLIVKTVAESHRIPTIAESVAALEYANVVARRITAGAGIGPGDGQIYQEASAIIEAVLDCHPDIGQAMVEAFRRGLLDVPYCVHPDNAGRSRSYIDGEGELRWADIGSLPLAGLVESRLPGTVGSAALMKMLSFVRNTFDVAALEGRTSRPIGEPHRAIPRGEPDSHGGMRGVEGVSGRPGANLLPNQASAPGTMERGE